MRSPIPDLFTRAKEEEDLGVLVVGSADHQHPKELDLGNSKFNWKNV
jgi:hypothetical protein